MRVGKLQLRGWRARLASDGALTRGHGFRTTDGAQSTADGAGLAAEALVLYGLGVPVHSRFIRAGGHRIHFLEAGAGPPIVFVHGHGGGAAVWHPVMEGLAPHAHLLAVDLLGWGLSERAAFAGRTPREAQAWWVESLEAWRVALGLERFTMVGHSLGGFVAASYALAHPERLDRLVLENAGGIRAPAALPPALYFRMVGPQRLVRLFGPAGHLVVRWARRVEAARTAVPGALADYYYELATRPGSAASGERAFARLLSLRRWRLPLLEAMRQVQTPTLLIWGENDTLIPPLTGYLLRTKMPAARLVIVTGAGHSPHAERPPAFVEALLSFLDEESSAGRPPSGSEKHKT
ncbi:MAG: alpha/beta fold hydrolase [Ardenticatenaceae bacterium]|nr:alpha/beta fold hydrolase [Ardenticatenaceae bacterium]